MLKMFRKPLLVSMLCFLGISVAHASTLTFFESTPEGLLWKWYSPIENTISIAHTFKEKPAAIFWEMNNELVYVFDQAQILTIDTKTFDVVASQDGPNLAMNETVIGIWRERKNKKLRLATRMLVEDLNIVGPQHAPVLKYGSGKSINGLAEPEWGLHAILRVLEYSPQSDEWAEVGVRATKTHAGDTPGLSVLRPLWNELGHSHVRLAASKHCRTFGDLFAGRSCDGVDQSMTFNQALMSAFPSCVSETGKIDFARHCPLDGIGIITCKTCAYDLLYPTVVGDGLHVVAPLYIRQNKSGGLKKIMPSLTSQSDQVLIGQSGSYVAVENPKVQPNIHVIDLTKGQVIFNGPGMDFIWMVDE